MSREFTMSMFRSKEDLYKAKAEYWENMFKQLADQYIFDVFEGGDMDSYDQVVTAMEISGGYDDQK